jgi:acyl-CoA synthetase (NDP forming)
MTKTSEIISTAYSEKRKNLLEPEAKAICQEYNIPVTKVKLAETIGQSLRFAHDIGYPIVMKIVSPDIIHKSDVNGVILNLTNQTEITEAYNAIIYNVRKQKPKARILGVLIQEMAPSSTEVIVGAIKDNQFGPSIMFGLGGIFVEILEDVSFRVAPITRRDAVNMITEIKAYPVLKGFRHQPAVDIRAISDIIFNTSKLVTDHQEIKELDLNPIMVYENGAKTVDARIILE